MNSIEIRLPQLGVVMGEMAVRLGAVRDQHVAAVLTRFIARSTVPSSGGLASSSAALISSTLAVILSRSGSGL